MVPMISIAGNGEFDLLLFLQKMAAALLIGLLLGIEREVQRGEDEKTFAGIRTFPLISLLGYLGAFAASITVIEVYIAILAIFGVFVTVSYYFSAKKNQIGSTSETAYILNFILGSLVFWDYVLIAAIAAVVIMIFLSLKSHLRKFAGKVEKEDIYATLKFAIITIIILPLLPDKAFGPYENLNPSKIWLMVVLISGISFTGYVLFKLMGAEKGVLMLAMLGGLASSTAVTLSFTQRSKEAEDLSKNFAGGIILASTIMFPRVFVIIYILSRELALSLILPFTVIILTGGVTSYFLLRSKKITESDSLKLKNPFEAATALKFGALFAAILFLTGAAKDYLGERGIYLAGALGGLVNLDAVALSLSDMAVRGVSITVVSAAILIACLANTVVKSIIALFFGSKSLRKYSRIGFLPLLAAITGAALILLL